MAATGDGRPQRSLVSGAAWSAVLLLAPLAGSSAASSWLWGIGAVLLVCVFPWAAARAGAGPVIIGAGALCFILLRLILWLDGPRELAAVIFAMIAAFTLTQVLPQRLRLFSSAAAGAVVGGGVFLVLRAASG